MTELQPEDLQTGDRIRVYLGERIEIATFTGYRYALNDPHKFDKYLHYRLDGERADHFVGKHIRVEKAAEHEKTGLQESEHWQERHTFFEQYPPEVYRLPFPGFPFNEPWPRWYRHRLFTIITYTGRVLKAEVDDSRWPRAEGIEWRSEEGPVGQQLVIAWKEIENDDDE